MKKLIVILLTLACSAVWAQSEATDSTAANDTEENVIGGRVQRTNAQREANVLGAPVYYNLDGSVRSRDNRHGNPRGEYVRPRHHWRNTLDSRFCSYFCEAEGMFGTGDAAIGINFTYLPEKWGVYGSLLTGFNHDYTSLGVAMRLADYDSPCDWHLYGGLTVGDGIGGELGMRIAAPKQNGNFGWCTGSMGMVFMDGEAYITLGVSLDVAALTALSLLLFW